MRYSLLAIRLYIFASVLLYLSVESKILRQKHHNKEKSNFCRGTDLTMQKLNACQDDPKKWNQANSALKKVLEKASISRDEKKSSVELIEREVAHTGSYYDRVRISNANEFDLNLLFELPIPMDPTFVRFNAKKVDQGFVRVEILKDLSLQVPQTHKLSNHVPDLKRKLFDQDGGIEYLDASKVKSWLESIADTTLEALPKIDGGRIRITHRKTGPAFTLQIHRAGFDDPVDVDLVPAFVFKTLCLKDHARLWPEIKNRPKDGRPKEFVVIPKPPKKDEKNIFRFWRLSFPNLESEIVKGQGVKNAIILLKAFRDANQDFKGIASYYMKTVVMHMVIESEKKGTVEKWKSEKNSAKIFMEALENLFNYLGRRGGLPHIFDFQNNLFSGLNPPTLERMRNRLERIRKILSDALTESDCKEKWLKFFNV